ncbi:MAG: FMN-binding negative transcriptional regulator [Alphaproteobacteria bacterium]|nr:FMN-binding negative transcriptional regulator [Alphaproteobacteria bacterium]MBV9151248.1 FMN-binding negative transcriptional regulator [Alphaproteobacteria bacterium]
MVYLPPHFTETREDVLFAHIERHDFGLLVTQGAAGLIASQIPFLAEQRNGKLYLQAHIARVNPQAADLDDSEEALAIFSGPHAYISPSWYETAPAVPTWNYASVHAYGAARRIDDPLWLQDLVRRLSERHEAREPQPWDMQGLPEPYVQSMLKGIVGIEIAVSRLEGKFKLSQNRPAGDRPRIIAALEQRDDPESHGVARLMREREPAS